MPSKCEKCGKNVFFSGAALVHIKGHYCDDCLEQIVKVRKSKEAEKIDEKDEVAERKAKENEERRKEDDSITKGFKYAIGIAFFLFLLFQIFKPQLIIAPINSEGEIILPEKSTETQRSYAQISGGKCPISCDDNNICTEDTCSSLTDFKCYYAKLDPCCGDTVCNEGENKNSCSSDCKGPIITVNKYEMKSEIGSVPEGLKSLDPKSLEILKPMHVSTAKPGKIFLILDLTIDNKESNPFRVSFFDMSLKDKEGYVYEYSPATHGFDESMNSIELQKDELLSRIVVFEIPNDKKEFVFKIDAQTSSGSTPISIK